MYWPEKPHFHSMLRLINKLNKP